jgi:hypothetical protein
MSSRKKIVVAIIIAVLVLPIILVTIGFWPGSTREAEEIADQLQPGEQWQLISIDNQPPRIICLQGHCGELRKIWHGPAAILKSCDDLATLASQFSEASKTRADQENFRNDEPNIMSRCDVHRKIAGENVTLSYRSYVNDKYSTLILNIGGN